MPILMVATYDANEKVNAPIIEEFPVVMECELLEFPETEYVSGIVGKIVNVKAEEAILSETGKIDPAKLQPLHSIVTLNGICNIFCTTNSKLAVGNLCQF